MSVSVCWGDSVLRARPSAPASRAERSDSPSLYAVSTSTLGGVGRSRSAASTSVPLIVGSSRSSTTTSGLCCCTSFTTSVPSVVHPATVMSGSPSSSARRPSSTMASSAASSTRIIAACSLSGQRDGERRTPARRALERERAPQHLDAVLDPAQPEVPAFHAHAFFARQHPLRVEPAPPVRDGEGERAALALDDHALLGRARVTVPVGERLLQDAIDRDLGRQRTVAQVVGEVELHALLGQRLVLHREALDDLAERAALEPGRPECPDEIADLAQRALEQAHRLPRPLLGGRIRGERALEHLQLGQRGENVLYRAVVHVEHYALQLALAGREQAPRGGPGLGVAKLGHARRDATSCGSRSATNPSTAPIASAIATRTPPWKLTARSPIATPAPANAPAV